MLGWSGPVPSYPVLVPGRGCIGMDCTSALTSPSDCCAEEAAAAAACARLPRLLPVLLLADMDACSEARSFIMRSFSSCLSACTVCACWRRLSSRENCLPQWQVNGRSPVCFLGYCYEPPTGIYYWLKART